MITKNFTKQLGKKINEYGEVVNFYEKNREGRFQTKNDLKKISNEINLELEKVRQRIIYIDYLFFKKDF